MLCKGKPPGTSYRAGDYHIAICGVVAGADTYEQIENFGKKRKRWLLKFLELPHEIPSHDTFGRIFERMKPNEFQNSFKRWIESVTELTKGQVIAINGKTLRRSLMIDQMIRPFMMILHCFSQQLKTCSQKGLHLIRMTLLMETMAGLKHVNM